MAETDDSRAEDSPSLTELLLRLGRDTSVLVFCEVQLVLSRHRPEVRRAALDVAAGLVVAAALLTAFAFANVAAYHGLSSAMSPWLAALVLAAAWFVVGAALFVALLVRAGRVTGWHWWRVFNEGSEGALDDLERARTEAEEALRETLKELAPALTVEIASAAVPLAGDMAGGALDIGEGILEASDDMVEALAEELPGGGIVNQIWDVALVPGRFGIRVATTVLRRGTPESDAAG